MRNDHTIAVIIPAINEARSIANVLKDIPHWVDDIIVADNGSSDDTPAIAQANGARVVHEPKRGYGSACLKGMAALNNPDIVVFLDGDYSDHPDQMDRLVDPIIENRASMVIGSRVLGHHAPGALTPQARFGNKLACFLMRLFWDVRHTDLGPFRAIRYTTLQSLAMADPDYGWTVEMQIKAALANVPTTEVPVDYRKRIGKSKVSGTIRGVFGAGYKILSTIFLSAIDWHLRGSKHSQQHHLLIFTRFPVPGKTKTRLIPALGPEGAAQLQKAMTEHALTTADTLPQMHQKIWYTGTDESRMADWLGAQRSYMPQPEGDLGTRMTQAFQHAFENGAKSATLIGIDSPGITPAIHTAAMAALKKHHIVIGPATDGGYYLIGMTAKAASTALPSIFTNVDWGTQVVYSQTLNHIQNLGLKYHRLAYLEDVDLPEDLPVHALNPQSEDTPKLSIIIPTLNEAENIVHTLKSLNQPGIEIIIADGGSTDTTCQLAEESGAAILHTTKGRSTQMNHGAARARARALLFLHADTQLPENFLEEVLTILSDPRVSCGAFQFSTGTTSLSMRLAQWGTNFRSRYLALPYGDQALFMTAQSFQAVSGYDTIPIMEDYILVRKLGAHGRIVLAPSRARTSPRRWQQIGHWKTFWINQLTIIAWHLGINPAKIARFYHRARQPRTP